MHPLHILIVDDDALLGEQLRSLLGTLGHPAVLCADPQQAMRRVDAEGFDLILCDYWMPTTTGMAFYQQISAQHPELAPRIVFLTGGVVGDETQFFIKSTGNLQLLKPYKLAAVVQLLDQVSRSPAVVASGVGH